MNPNEKVSEESKNSAIKVLAIVGSIAVVVLGVWLAVQIVQVLPSAFSSLASITEGLYDSESSDEFAVESEKDVTNSGEAFTVAWTDTDTNGTYTFNYVCMDGVSVDVRAGGEVTSNVSCVSGFAIPAGVTSIDVIATSEKKRFVDLEFSIVLDEGGDAPRFAEDRKVTVVNPAIPTDGIAAEDDADEEPADEPDTAPAPAPKPRTITKQVSYIPQSDPNGFVDLQARVLGTGTLRGNTFTPRAVVEADDDTAIQIEVKNIGTKTSDEWDLDVELPNGGDFTLDEEKGLKPNERVVLSIRFDARDLDGTERFDGDVDVDDDISNSNNDFSGTMRFED